MMRTSAPRRDLRRRRAEENEEGFTGSFSKKTPPKKGGRSDRWNQYTFTSVMAVFELEDLKSHAHSDSCSIGSTSKNIASISHEI
ncbi:MAG: hypothetical protein OXQ89_10000, partial [Rhodospirillaceae bacterium]|nr:hypothetical protein [Rhodospirillaceae bacterium]